MLWATFFNHFYAIRPTKFHEITEPIGLLAYYGIQGHRFWYQSKAHIRLPISD